MKCALCKNRIIGFNKLYAYVYRGIKIHAHCFVKYTEKLLELELEDDWIHAVTSFHARKYRQR